jgi:hypothetical protein|tara:strand:+ start:327 stop:605 length:279 start_codon:yes stop_codon:yes gene_type:complete
LFLLRSFLTLFKNNTLLLWGKEISSIHKVKKGNKMKKELNLPLRLTEEEHKVLRSLIGQAISSREYSTSARKNILKDVKKQIEENLENTFWK